MGSHVGLAKPPVRQLEKAEVDRLLAVADQRQSMTRNRSGSVAELVVFQDGSVCVESAEGIDPGEIKLLLARAVLHLLTE